MPAQSPALPFASVAPPETWEDPDAVYTPRDLARFLLELLDWTDVHRVLEPSAGGSAWIDEIVRLTEERKHFLSVVGVDINPYCQAGDANRFHRLFPLGSQWMAYQFVAGDVLQLDTLGQFDLAVGNPPYTDIPTHVERALELAERVAFLLPLDLLGGDGPRPRWFMDSPASWYVPLLERPWPAKLRGVGLFEWDRRLPPLSQRRDEPIGYPTRSWKGGE